MTRLFLLAPFALAACGNVPCPVPVSCVEPFGCTCILTPASGGAGDDGGSFTAPERGKGPTVDDHGPSDDHNGGDSGSSDENGGHSK